MDIRSLPDLLSWMESAPAGTTLSAAAVAELLSGLIDREPSEPTPLDPPDWTWRERLWTVPAETRIGATELAEAVGRSKSWVYRRTMEGAEHPLPVRKLDGELVFTVGELRTWIRHHEEIHHALPMDSTPWERGGMRAAR